MKYFVVSDVHGYYNLLINTLSEKGFDINNPTHKLIICGDMFDRGGEVKEMQAFIISLLERDKVILIRGNHEDLMLEYIEDFKIYYKELPYSHHFFNGTVDTAFKLCEKDWTKNNEYITCPDGFLKDLKNTPFVKYVIPKTLDYFETDRYIFTHGYVPCIEDYLFVNNTTSIDLYSYDENWRNSSKESWQKARWYNGQYIAKTFNITEPKKTIVFGHYPCSYGHENFEKKRKNKNKEVDDSPFYSKGIIAIDAQTARSQKINCLVIDD